MRNKRREMYTQLLIFALCSLYVSTEKSVEDTPEDSHRQKRSTMPKLEMTVTYQNVTAMMHSGSTFYYKVAIKHGQGSSADGQGTKVLFVLNPFVVFKEVKSYTINKPQPVVKDDSVIMKLNDIIWSSEPTFEFAVTFNGKKKLKTGKHHVVTHAQLIYYDNYAEDAQGVVTSKGTFYKLPLQTLKFDVEIPGCTKPLGMDSKEIKDYQIGASSSYAEAQPSQAREFDDGWCAYISNGEQFLQIDFTTTKRITGISTIRRRSKPHWLTEYFIMYSLDGEEWKTYNENGFKKLFSGNTISFGAIVHWLADSFQAISIRIRPTKWEILICLRLELYGCSVKGSGANCISPLGMESSAISDEALTDKRPVVVASDMSQTNNSRVNVPVFAFPYGWMSDSSSEYLQVDLGSLHRITRAAIQGGYTAKAFTMFFVKTYTLSFSNNTIDWVDYSENGKPKVIEGSTDRFAAKHPKIKTFARAISARYVRFNPLMGGDAGMRVMRVELYGCLKDPFPPYKDITDLEFYRRSFLVDPLTDQFFICMFTDNRIDSSCFATNNTKEWNAIHPKIVYMVGANPRDKELYALDRFMNLHRTTDSGIQWTEISREYYDLAVNETTVHKARGIPDNFVSKLPTTNTTLATGTGAKWGVSSSNIHFMTAGGSAWSTVGSWKCCGM